MRAHVGEWVLKDRDRPGVAGLGVVDHDEADVEAPRGTRGEVVVSVVTRIARVLLISGRTEAAVQPRRALDGGIAARSKPKRCDGRSIRRDGVRVQDNVLSIA